MACLWSICCCHCFWCWKKTSRKGSRFTPIFSCCSKKKCTADEWTTHDSFLRRQGCHSEDTEFSSFNKQDIETPVKEEVEILHESSQQLEPEILNCATERSLYNRSQSFYSRDDEQEDDNVIDKQHLTKDFPAQSSMNTNPLCATNPTHAIHHLQKRTGEKSTASDGNALRKSLSEHSINPELLEDSRTLEGSTVANSKQDIKASGKLSLQPPRKGTDLTDDRAREHEMAHVPDDYEREQKENQSDSFLSVTCSSNTPKLTSVVIEDEENVGTGEIKYLRPDIEEDIYRDGEEIQKEKKKNECRISEEDSNDHKLGVGPEMDIVEYCQREWRGKTAVAKIMKEGYEEVSHHFTSVRRVRGDNYCALRATLFQALSQTSKLPLFLDDEELSNLPEKLIKNYDWIKQWRFWHKHESKKVFVRIKQYLELLKKKWAELSTMKIPKEKQAACDEIFRNEEEEYCLYEAVKFLMLKTAIDLYNANEEGKEVPVFSWLLFARNTSNNPCEFMKNHLNQVGHTGGLEQVEMFLLGYTLQLTIKVYRLYKFATDEFITQYPNDKPDWPSVTLITEDDRHYNVPVGEYEETSL
ncbi:ubiquitin thioesterase otulin [Spea bombifrons]|uniref:ubiquitin thioesterase otulin n=1 Tax=Spea bombifrons TaxID=233779 RepID=UPI00234BF408|nr:ubiquitin thioesterase otulin [Spea bombifrons]